MVIAKPKRPAKTIYVRAMDKKTRRCRSFTLYNISAAEFERLVRRAVEEHESASGREKTGDCHAGAADAHHPDR